MATVKLLVDDPNALDTDDAAIKARLEGLGHTVTPALWSGAAAHDGADLIVQSSDIGSYGTAGPNYSAIDRPLLALARSRWTDIGWSTSSGGTAYGSGLTDILITDDAHPIAGGYSGQQTVYTAGLNFTVPTTPPASLQRVAAAHDGTQNTIFYFASGAALLGGKTAAADQVGFAFSNRWAASVTAVAWDLFDAAVAWLLPVAPDVTNPTVTIDDPTPAGQTAGYEHVAGVVSVTWTAADETALDRVDLYLDGVLLQAAASSPHAWDTSAVANGSHTLMATAVDAALNEASDSVAVVVNNSGWWRGGTPMQPVTWSRPAA